MHRARWVAIVSVLAILASTPAGAVGTPGGALKPTPFAIQTAGTCSFPLTLIDAGGAEVTVPEAPERVVTLGPSAAQTMWEIGAREKVAGVTTYAAYLDGATAKTNVSGSEQFVVLERVVALEPDLVLAPNTVTPDTVGKLREAGLTVYHFPAAESIEDVETKVLTIGRLVGECQGADETVMWMRERLGVVDEAIADQERPSVLYLFYGYTAGEGTFIHEVIQRAGGDNLAAEVGVSGYRQLSEEVVVDRDPEWIVLNSEDPALPDSPAVRGTTAGRENRTVVVRIEYLNQPAPRVVYAVEMLVRAFHPEAYARANATGSAAPSETLKTGVQQTSTARDTDPSSTPAVTATPGQPGLGPISAVIAIVALCLTARRAW